MYILNHRPKRTRRLVLLVLFLPLLVGGAIFGRDMLAVETSIGPAPAAVVTKVANKEKAPKKITEALYSFELPNDWEKFTPTSPPANSLSWRNTVPVKGTKMITVYTDAAVSNMGINRVVAVQSAGENLTLNGGVSENCTTFTNSAKIAGTNLATAKWQGVDFLCDTGNYVRNVAGTATTGSLNSVQLIGPDSGQHSMFMTYNDTSVNPNFDSFTAMLRSFKMK